MAAFTFFQIQGSSTPTSVTRQLHLAYHNGDHYSSVRTLGDNTESPTSIRLKVKNYIPQYGPRSENT